MTNRVFGPGSLDQQSFAMPSKLLTITGACAMLAIGYFVFDAADPAPQSPVSPQLTEPAPSASASNAPRFGDHPSHIQSGSSPFSGAAARETALTQQRHDAREKRMAQGGYGTPAEYFYLPLTKLKELASNGDIYALLQLGQQYWDEPDVIASEAGFDTSAPPNKLAVEYLSRAVMAGATQPALTLATRLSASDPTESYAWALFAEKLQIPDATETATKLRTRLSDRDIDVARISADQKLGRMTQATAAANLNAARVP